ncbi:MAG TPA: FIST N-terminal domain-containing protein [Micromonosporaceae bacterium]
MTGRPGRWIRVGHASLPDAQEAGTAAARHACDGGDAKLLVVFAGYRYDLGALLDGVASVAGDAPVIGCSTTMPIGPGPPGQTDVVAVGFGGDIAVTTACASELSTRTRAVGAEVGRGLLPLPDSRHRVALFLTDPLAGDQQEMVRGAYGVLGATVTLAGGGAGDQMPILTSRQFYGGKVLENAVVGALLGTDGPVGLAIRHGWQCEGDPMMVTAGRGYEAHSFDDRPALDVYLAQHRAPPGIEYDEVAFAEFALTRPLAIGRRGEVAVRHVLGADPDNRTLNCAGCVPKGATAWLATGDVASAIAAAGDACADALSQLGGAPALALLVFDCAGRLALLGEDGAIAEHAVIHQAAGDTPVAGLYTYGEIARRTGAIGFHNQTFVALALG